ncbi:hypothetical protein L484_023793 [Morus notabilis]|uniref:Uncharacterized protein n=1 Tax=Morus notabilis TaxID=981085 RepID=W9R566_9ROSA|nr:hypothetical protein L484_023793 [Morus notabilis]
MQRKNPSDESCSTLVILLVGRGSDSGQLLTINGRSYPHKLITDRITSKSIQDRYSNVQNPFSISIRTSNIKSPKCPRRRFTKASATIAKTSQQNSRSPDQPVVPESSNTVELDHELSSTPTVECFGVDDEHELVVRPRVFEPRGVEYPRLELLFRVNPNYGVNLMVIFSGSEHGSWWFEIIG